MEERVIAIIADKLGLEKNEIDPTKKFIDLGADSLDVVELIMDFETEFDISIPDSEAEKIRTVGDIIDSIKNKKSTPNT
jgi:acyl carrier protein